MVNIAREMSSATTANAPPHRPIRADTLDLKEKLAVALGQNGARYWQTLVQFLKGAIDRSEFEALAHKALKAEHGKLHPHHLCAVLLCSSSEQLSDTSSLAFPCIHPSQSISTMH